MTKDDIIIRLRKVMQGCAETQRDWDAVNETTPVDQLGFDSLTMLDLLYDIQHEFGIKADPEILAEIQTVGDAAEKIRQQSNR